MQPWIVAPKKQPATRSWWVNQSREDFAAAVKREAARMHASQLTPSGDLGLTARLTWKQHEREDA